MSWVADYTLGLIIVLGHLALLSLRALRGEAEDDELAVARRAADASLRRVN